MTGTDLVRYEPRPQREERVSEFLRLWTDRLHGARYGLSLWLHRARNRPKKVRTGRVIAVVPAHNEEAVIERTLMALLNQTRAPVRVLVVADNCTDTTVAIARRFGKRVTVIETVGNTDRKVGALRTAWQEYAAYGYDYMLGVDADTVMSPNSLQALEDELERNPKAGGVMARYTFDPDLGQTKFG